MSALGVTGTARLFQFTPLREGRPGMDDVRFKLQVFQFTPLREGRRLSARMEVINNGYFNSRPSARGDALAQPH